MILQKLQMLNDIRFDAFIMINKTYPFGGIAVNKFNSLVFL